MLDAHSGQTNQGEGDPVSSTGLFPKTLWSDVRCAARSEAAESFKAISILCERYRRPLLLHLQKVVGPDRAEDSLQSFLVKMIDPAFYARLAPEDGRFRSFLLTCLKNHLYDEWRKQGAKRRGDGITLASLDEVNEDGQQIMQPSSDVPLPDEEFDRAWARTILYRAFNKLESEYRAKKNEAFFRVAKPILLGEAVPEKTDEVARRLSMTHGNYRVALTRLKGRLKDLVKEQIEPTVATEEDLRNEISYMTELFGMRSFTELY